MRKTFVLMPKTEAVLKELGENIKMARLRRNLPMSLICDRADISRSTLWQVEKGNPGVAIGVYAAVLHAIDNSDKELANVLKDDQLGKTLLELGVKNRKRAK